SEAKRLSQVGFIDAANLEHHPVRLDHRDPAVGRALAGTHASFGLLRRHGLVGEDPDPVLATALHLASHGAAGSFDLAGVDPRGPFGLDAEFTKGDGISGVRDAAAVAAMLLAMLD